MKIIKDMLKGACIGISNVIPGFSGGTMAVMLKIYDRIVCGIADIIHHPIKVIKDLLWLIIGMVIGLLLAVLSISFLLDKFPFPTIIFFVGLIIGSIPGVFNDTRRINDNKLNILWSIPAIVTLVILAFVNTGNKTTEIGFLPLMLIFLVGLAASATMVVPGVSGSLTLIALGYYEVIIDDIKAIIKNVFHLGSVSNELVFILFFVIGCIIGIILISKLIKVLLDRYRAKVYFFILGLLTASIFVIIYSLIKNDDYDINYSSVGMWICSVILLIVGILFPIIMGKLANNKDDENKAEDIL